MGRSQREKGTRGELEVAHVWQAGGFPDVARVPNSGGLQTKGDLARVPGLHLEVKRQERIRVEEWFEQAETEAPPGLVPVVIYRRSHNPWKVTLHLEEFVPIYWRSLQ